MSAGGRSKSRPGGKRASLPGADELFRPTGQGSESEAPAAASRHVMSSGRQRHDAKITVYVSADELVELERARLTLRAEHGVAVDRGRIVREAIAFVLADLAGHGEESLLVRRLQDGAAAEGLS